jgi:hypothetical protein
VDVAGSDTFQTLKQSSSWTVPLSTDTTTLLRSILGLLSMVVMKASEVSTAALYIDDDDDDDDDAMITNAKTAKRHRFGSEVNINYVVV